MEFPRQLKLVMKLVLEFEWLLVTIRRLLLLLLNKPEFSIEIGFNRKETVQLWRVNSSENLLEVSLIKDNKTKLSEIYKISKL